MVLVALDSPLAVVAVSLCVPLVGAEGTDCWRVNSIQGRYRHRYMLNAFYLTNNTKHYTRLCRPVRSDARPCGPCVRYNVIMG